MVFVTPDKLREIAGCLERQEQRAKDQTALSLGSSLNVVEGLDSLHTQLHSGEITVWFRNAAPKEELKCNWPGDLSSTSVVDAWERHYHPKSQHGDGRLDNGSIGP